MEMYKYIGLLESRYSYLALFFYCKQSRALKMKKFLWENGGEYQPEMMILWLLLFVIHEKTNVYSLWSFIVIFITKHSYILLEV